MRTFAIAAAAFAVAGLAGNAHAAGKCQMVGGESTMVTIDLAKFMAEAAMKNAIAAHGLTGTGAIRSKCDAPYGLPHCTAYRKAC